MHNAAMMAVKLAKANTIIKEFIDLCAIGDVTDDSPNGWGSLIQEAKDHIGFVEPTSDKPKIHYMNIYAATGSKVIFHGEGGYPYEKVSALQEGFVVGQTYTVFKTEVGHSRSTVRLVELPGDWNTVLFGPLKRG